jgi:hypothetical protein
MDPGALIFLFLFTTVGIGITYANYASVRASFAQLFSTIDSPQIQGILPPVLIGKFRNHSIRVNATPGGKNQPPSMHILIYRPTSFILNIQREGFWQKLGKAAGILEEIEIGIQDFDDRYLIRTGDRQLAENFLSSRMARDDIDELFTLGFTGIEVMGGAVRLSKTSADLGVDLDPQRFRQILKKFITLIDQL